MDVRFHYQAKVNLPAKKQVKMFLPKIALKEKTNFESADIIFCTDEYLLDINKRFLNHDYYTDIITFNLAGNNQPIAAELYISLERVKENAKAAGVAFSEETLRVIFHGILHLCGYGDKTPENKKLMRSKEDLYLKLYKSIL